MTVDRLVLTLSRMEARVLSDVLAQFTALLTVRDGTSDPALDRLAPSAYPDDDDADREFRESTRSELLARREEEALQVLGDLTPAFLEGPADLPAEDDLIEIVMDAPRGWAWMRTLTAVRLLIATRLGITDDDDHRPDDDRFAVYDWLGYRLDGIVAALGDD